VAPRRREQASPRSPVRKWETEGIARRAGRERGARLYAEADVVEDDELSNATPAGGFRHVESTGRPSTSLSGPGTARLSEGGQTVHKVAPPAPWPLPQRHDRASSSPRANGSQHSYPESEASPRVPFQPALSCSPAPAEPLPAPRTEEMLKLNASLRAQLRAERATREHAKPETREIRLESGGDDLANQVQEAVAVAANAPGEAVRVLDVTGTGPVVVRYTLAGTVDGGRLAQELRVRGLVQDKRPGRPARKGCASPSGLSPVPSLAMPDAHDRWAALASPHGPRPAEGTPEEEGTPLVQSLRQQISRLEQELALRPSRDAETERRGDRAKSFAKLQSIDKEAKNLVAALESQLVLAAAAAAAGATDRPELDLVLKVEARDQALAERDAELAWCESVMQDQRAHIGHLERMVMADLEAKLAQAKANSTGSSPGDPGGAEGTPGREFLEACRKRGLLEEA